MRAAPFFLSRAFVRRKEVAKSRIRHDRVTGSRTLPRGKRLEGAEGHHEETRGWRARYLSRGSVQPVISWPTMTASVSHAGRLRDPDSSSYRYCYLDRHGRSSLISGRDRTFAFANGGASTRERSNRRRRISVARIAGKRDCKKKSDIFAPIVVRSSLPPRNPLRLCIRTRERALGWRWSRARSYRC